MSPVSRPPRIAMRARPRGTWKRPPSGLCSPGVQIRTAPAPKGPLKRVRWPLRCAHRIAAGAGHTRLLRVDGRARGCVDDEGARPAPRRRGHADGFLLPPGAGRGSCSGDHRCAALSRRRRVGGRRLPRRGGVLRPVRLPDHLAAHRRVAPDGHDRPGRILGPARPSAPPGAVLHGHGRGHPRGSLRAAECGSRAAVRRDWGAVLFQQLASDRQPEQLLHRHRPGVPAPTHLVAGDRGTVLRLLAGPPRGPDLAHPPPGPPAAIGTPDAGGLLAVSIVGAVASVVEAAILFHHGSGANRIYYGTDTRAMRLLTGAALAPSAWPPSRRTPRPNRAMREPTARRAHAVDQTAACASSA
jgi:hypothetical protein